MRGCGCVDSQTLGKRRHRRFRGSTVELHAPTEEIVRVEIAEQQVGIGDSRLCAAQPVTSRPRVCPGRFWTDLEQAQIAQMGNTATARADFDQLDGGHAHGQAAASFEAVDTRNLKVVAHRGLTVADHTHLCCGAAHVKGDEIRLAGHLAIKDRRQHSCCRPRFDQTYRE